MKAMIQAQYGLRTFSTSRKSRSRRSATTTCSYAFMRLASISVTGA
jgi:hypothetical protein